LIQWTIGSASGLGGAESLSPPPELSGTLLVSESGHICTSQDADATPTSYSLSFNNPV